MCLIEKEILKDKLNSLINRIDNETSKLFHHYKWILIEKKISGATLGAILAIH